MTKMIHLSNTLFWFPSMKNVHKKKIKVSLPPASVAYVVLENMRAKNDFNPCLFKANGMEHFGKKHFLMTS